jgi:ribosome-associated protein
MKQYNPKAEDLKKELTFLTSRSSGPGGQNVNKVNTKVTLRFDVANSELLSAEQKEIIIKKLSSRITKDGTLVLTAQDKNSQLQNKEMVIKKLDDLLTKAFTVKKVRKRTKPGKTAIQARKEQKKRHSEKKKWRQKP